jgi:pyruvate/2-oxoglutarate dehydrogenase complex dihydrolipoamide dehydrogenase (E3) component
MRAPEYTCRMLGWSPHRKRFRCADICRYTHVDAEVSLKKFMQSKRKELQRLNNAYSDTLGRAKVEKLVGRGRLVDPHTVDINGKKVTAKYICVAVGGLPNMLKIPGALCTLLGMREKLTDG